MAKTPLSIPLDDGDALLNASAAAEHLGISEGTLSAHLSQRETAARPLPEPVADPVGILVADEEAAERVRTLMSMTGNRRAGGIPQVWLRSGLDRWDRERLRRRSE
ncbi:hypothetical protein [Streptomonospora salina]|uniref:Uncharacterized protein n=1 Tax=Streptomonospora salina TaxID=104205 RepID=A0A841E6I8_9ACTN|nr:hypothetical protein [Streptomonospora salina]MBB5998775.1 hypothetical protein [Streptomonospora salina]